MKDKFSSLFVLMATGFIVCLVASNFFAAKLIHIFGMDLPGAVLVFPLSYILNDCICEVWGYRKARFIIWTAFLMNFLVILLGQILVWMPAAPFWDGTEHFNYMFNLAPRIAAASLLAFLTGSWINAAVLSKMKVASHGHRFGLRAIVSSLAGEGIDSLIFIPVAFWGLPFDTLGLMMLSQVSFKLAYEMLILPLTSWVVKQVKRREKEDTYDQGISYNPFRIADF